MWDMPPPKILPLHVASYLAKFGQDEDEEEEVEVEVDEDVARRTKQRFDELKAVEAKKHFRARVRSLDPLAGVYADNRYPSEIASTDTSVKCKLKVTS